MSFFSLLNRRWLSRGAARTVLFGTVCLTSIAVVSLLLVVGEIRLALTVVVGFTLVILATVSIRLSTVATLVYLVLMGDIRRLLIPVAGWSGTDPLLLIGPAFAVILTAYVFATKRAQFSTQLAPWILALMAIMALQIMNPRQGGLMVGIAGAMFYIIPLLWYWIGQVYATTKFVETILFRIVVPLAFLGISVGLYQVFFGYMPHQQLWFDCCAYTALGVDGIQAPISMFASAIEYSVFTVVAAILLWGRFLKSRNPLLLISIVPLVIAIFLVGSRGPIAQLLAVAAGLWAAMSTNRTMWFVRGGVAVLIAGTVLTLALMQVGKVSESVGNERIQHRMERQATGFLHMGDPSKSTATTHKRMMILGISRGIQNPLGDGLGSTTKAAHKFGRPEGISGSMEVDISNIFLSTGTFGGLMYLYIVFIIVRNSIVYWHSKRTLVGLCLAGLLGVTFLSWLAGGRYALAPLIWFAVGALDRFHTDYLNSVKPDT